MTDICKIAATELVRQIRETGISCGDPYRKNTIWRIDATNVEESAKAYIDVNIRDASITIWFNGRVSMARNNTGFGQVVLLNVPLADPQCFDKVIKAIDNARAY